MTTPDTQLPDTASFFEDPQRQPPVQAESRTDLREKLSVESGGVVFTTDEASYWKCRRLSDRLPPPGTF